MKTKREMLEYFVKYGNCRHLKCSEECPYNNRSNKYCSYCYLSTELKKIGAMAILRMFPKKKKPMLSVGTKIKFNDGSIAIIDAKSNEMGDYDYSLLFKDKKKSIDYLINKAWEFVEE